MLASGRGFVREAHGSAGSSDPSHRKEHVVLREALPRLRDEGSWAT